LEPELDPGLPDAPEPMWGQGCLPVDPVDPVDPVEPALGAPDLAAPGGVVGVGVVAVVVVSVALGAAAAPAMPATAPVVASAPATIVAPSILDMVMRTSWVDRLLVRVILRPPAKRTRMRA
jgi:hypothetical protein